MSRIFVDLIRANSAIDLGRPQEALFLIDHNLQAAYMQRDDFRIHRYDHFAAKGEALKRLSQYSEALDWLVKAPGPVFQ